MGRKELRLDDLAIISSHLEFMDVHDPSNLLASNHLSIFGP